MMTDEEFQGFVVAKLDSIEKQVDDLSDRVYSLASGAVPVRSAGRGGAALLNIAQKILMRS